MKVTVSEPCDVIRVSVCLSVCSSDYTKSYQRICMKLLSEVCLGPLTNPRGCSWLRSVSRINNFGGGLQSRLSDQFYNIMATIKIKNIFHNKTHRPQSYEQCYEAFHGCTFYRIPIHVSVRARGLVLVVSVLVVLRYGLFHILRHISNAYERLFLVTLSL